MNLIPTFYLYPPPEVREFIHLCRKAQILSQAVDAVLNQFVMSLFINALGQDSSYDNERIRLTIDMNFVLYHTPWRDDWGTFGTPREDRVPATPRHFKDAIIEQGIVMYHALRSNQPLMEYLKHLALNSVMGAAVKRSESGHMRLIAQT